MAFRCVVLTPEMQVLDATASQVVIPAHDGLMGILTGRAPLLVKLGKGPLTVDNTDGKQQVYSIEGGVAQMKDDVLTVMTTKASEAAAV